MNCPNCAAAMHLVESRRYFVCRHCGTNQFPGTIEEDGIRIVGHTAEAPNCPVCREAMAHALLDGDHPIDFCLKCRGVLLPRSTFALVVQKRRAWATRPPSEPVPLDRRELHRELRCPSCGSRLDTYPHLGPGAIVIDSCLGCDRIWLDFGELNALVDAPGRDRGSRHVARVDEDYVRRGDPPHHDDEREGRPRGRRRRDPLGMLVDALLGD